MQIVLEGGHNTVLDHLNNLRLKGALCDVNIYADDGSVLKAHSVVLAASSSVLSQILCGKQLPVDIVLPSVTAYSWTLLLQFIYTNKIVIAGIARQRTFIQALYNAATWLKLSDLIRVLNVNSQKIVVADFVFTVPREKTVIVSSANDVGQINPVTTTGLQGVAEIGHAKTDLSCDRPGDNSLETPPYCKGQLSTRDELGCDALNYCSHNVIMQASVSDIKETNTQTLSIVTRSKSKSGGGNFGKDTAKPPKHALVDENVNFKSKTNSRRTKLNRHRNKTNSDYNQCFDDLQSRCNNPENKLVSRHNKQGHKADSKHKTCEKSESNNFKQTEKCKKGRGTNTYKCLNEECGTVYKKLNEYMTHLKGCLTGNRYEDPINLLQKTGTKFKLVDDKSPLPDKQDVNFVKYPCYQVVEEMLKRGKREYKHHFKCEHCKLKEGTQRRIVDHIANVHRKRKPFVCQMCEKGFYGLQEIKDHFLRFHSSTSCFKCDQCEEEFKCKDTLRTHTITEHRNVDEEGNPLRRFKCCWCPKAFKLQHHKKRHEMFHLRSEDKPFQCDHCKKRFVMKLAMIEHSRVHTGEKPFKCKECPFSTRRMFNLRLHERTHGYVNAKFKCHTCSRVFCQKSSFQNHKKKFGHSGARIPVADKKERKLRSSDKKTTSTGLRKEGSTISMDIYAKNAGKGTSIDDCSSRPYSHLYKHQSSAGEVWYPGPFTSEVPGGFLQQLESIDAPSQLQLSSSMDRIQPEIIPKVVLQYPSQESVQAQPQENHSQISYHRPRQQSNDINSQLNITNSSHLGTLHRQQETSYFSQQQYKLSHLTNVTSGLCLGDQNNAKYHEMWHDVIDLESLQAGKREEVNVRNAQQELNVVCEKITGHELRFKKATSFSDSQQGFLGSSYHKQSNFPNMPEEEQCDQMSSFSSDYVKTKEGIEGNNHKIKEPKSKPKHRKDRKMQQLLEDSTSLENLAQALKSQNHKAIPSSSSHLDNQHQTDELMLKKGDKLPSQFGLTSTSIPFSVSSPSEDIQQLISDTSISLVATSQIIPSSVINYSPFVAFSCVQSSFSNSSLTVSSTSSVSTPSSLSSCFLTPSVPSPSTISTPSDFTTSPEVCISEVLIPSIVSSLSVKNCSSNT